MLDEAKLILTAGILLAAIGVYWVDPSADNAGPDSFWRLGRNDPFRNLICREDGTFRRYTKLGIYLWFVVGLVLIWRT